MPRQKRISTGYPGVFKVEVTDPQTGKETVAFYIRYRKETGKLIEEKVGLASRGMTAARANQERAKRIEGKALSNVERRAQEEAVKLAEEARLTISKLWDVYRAGKAHNKSIAVDENRFNNHLKDAVGDKTPDQLITLDVDRIRSKLLKTHSPQTTKHVIDLLKRTIRYGVKKGLIDPPSPRRLHFESPSFDNRLTERLTDSQLKSLLEAAEVDVNWKARNLVRLALATGMRKGEMLNLKWSDIDLDAGFITLPRTKSGKVQRVPINAMAKEVLDHLPRTKHDLLFPGRDGQPLRNIYDALRRIRERAGLPETVRPLHALRHAFASKLASSGVGLYVVQKLLRHGDQRMTERYSELADEALRNGSERAAELFSGLHGNGAQEENEKVVNLQES